MHTHAQYAPRMPMHTHAQYAHACCTLTPSLPTYAHAHSCPVYPRMHMHTHAQYAHVCPCILMPSMPHACPMHTHAQYAHVCPCILDVGAAVFVTECKHHLQSRGFVAVVGRIVEDSLHWIGRAVELRLSRCSNRDVRQLLSSACQPGRFINNGVAPKPCRQYITLHQWLSCRVRR